MESPLLNNFLFNFGCLIISKFGGQVFWNYDVCSVVPVDVGLKWTLQPMNNPQLIVA